MEIWKAVKLIGLVGMVFGSIIFLIDVYEYTSGKIQISNGSKVEVIANMDYSRREYVEVGIKKREYRWFTKVTYTYNDTLYTDIKRAKFSSLPDNSPLTIYVNDDNPEVYLYERDITIIGLLSIFYPIMGTGLFILAKKNEY